MGLYMQILGSSSYSKTVLWVTSLQYKLILLTQSTPIVAYCCSCCLFVCMFMFMVWGDVTKLKKNRVANWLMCGNFVTHFKKCKQHSVVWRVFWKEQRTKCKACAWFLVRLSLVMLLMTRKHPVRLCLVQALQPGILSLQVCTPWVRKSGQIIFWHFVLCHEPMIEIYAAVPGSTQQVKKNNQSEELLCQILNHFLVHVSCQTPSGGAISR